MNFIKPNIIFLFLSVLLVSCGVRKGVAVESDEVRNLKTSEIVRNVTQSNLEFKDLSIQSRIDANIDGSSTGLNGKIYIKKDKVIWINISKFGFTAARALITPKGVSAYEKVDGTYIDGDFSYFNDLLKVDFIDFEKLQNLLLGRMFVDLNSSDFDSQITENKYILTYKKNDKILRGSKPGEYWQSYSFDGNFRLTDAVIKVPKSAKELEIKYSNWQNIGNQEFPRNVKVLVKDKKTQKIELEYNNFTFEKSDTPFKIPSGYKLRKI